MSVINLLILKKLLKKINSDLKHTYFKLNPKNQSHINFHKSQFFTLGI